MLGSQPTEGNIRGGLTTIRKGHGQHPKDWPLPITSVLNPPWNPKAPACTSWIVQRSREMITLCGALVPWCHYFPTGQGNRDW